MAPRLHPTAPSATLTLLLAFSSLSACGRPFHHSSPGDLFSTASGSVQTFSYEPAEEKQGKSSVALFTFPQFIIGRMESHMITTTGHSAPFEFPVQHELHDPSSVERFPTSVLGQNGGSTLSEERGWRNEEWNPFLRYRGWRRKRNSRGIDRGEGEDSLLVGPVDRTNMINVPAFRTTPRSNRRRCPAGQQVDMAGRCRISFG